jgi:DNA-binding NarL/FixJ family response regulator
MSAQPLRQQAVLVADRDPAIRHRITGAFARLGYAAVEAADGEAALQALRARTPALVIAEVALPEVSGYELCREVKDAHDDGVGVILLSALRTEPFDRVAGLLLGADDYLVKPFDTDELLARSRRFLRGAEQKAAEGSRLRMLTPRETEVLDLLLDGLPQNEIAARLVISPKTASTHLQRILTKLGAHSRAQAVAIALRERGRGGPSPRPVG